MGGDPWISLETNKWGADRLSWEVDYEQYVSGSLPLVPLQSFCSLIVDTVPGTGNEVTIHMARVTLDHQQRMVGITRSSMECRPAENSSLYVFVQ